MNLLQEKAERFHALHHGERPLVLANVWDVPSARVVASTDVRAIATTSSGVAWSAGVADGDHIDRATALDHARRIAAAVDVPVTVDIESGFGSTPADVAGTITGVLGAGAVGVNIEDVHPAERTTLRDVDEQAERIAAARRAADDAGVALFVNARVDVYLRSVGASDGRLSATLERAAAYVEAGADGVFVPGVVDVGTVAALANGIDAPLNILAGPGAPDTTALHEAGAARVSVGGGVAAAAYAVARRAALELVNSGTYSAIEGAIPYPELNSLMLSAEAVRS